MIRILLLVFLLFLVRDTGIGQRRYNANRFKYYLSPTFSYGSSNVIDSTTDFVGFKRRSLLFNPSYSSGVYFNYMLRDRWSYYSSVVYGFKTGVVYSAINQTIEIDTIPGFNPNDIITIKYRYDLIEVPLLFTRASTQNTILAYELGPMFVYNITNRNFNIAFAAKTGIYGTVSKRIGYYALVGGVINRIQPGDKTRISFVMECTATYRLIR
jgi:hypothetical protein